MTVEGLNVGVEGKDLVIRLPVEVIPLAFEVGPGYDVFNCDDRPARIVDTSKFVDALVEALNDEIDETGLTLVSSMFDQAMIRAVEHGAEGVSLPL
jgi:hypothetical protein